MKNPPYKMLKKSFENCYPFIYYLEHGKNYYELYKVAPFSIQPMLLFYGISQLFKACLLTIDPNYPESTTVLAHGVTTRKRKKQGYQFLEDEVKVQKKRTIYSCCRTAVSHETLRIREV